MDLVGILIIVAGIFVLLALISHRKKAERKKYLIEKYGLEIAEKIIEKKVWRWMTCEQLIDSWGQPEDRDEAVYKTKIKETWKYGNFGKNRYRQRVYVEGGYVVGWKNQ
jgi:hypothetical protein